MKSAKPLTLPVLIGLALLTSACATTQPGAVDAPGSLPKTTEARRPASVRPVGSDPQLMYREIKEGDFRVAGVDTSRMKPSHVRQVVDYSSSEAPGTIVVDQSARYLYLVQPNGKAIRYAVGVGPVARAFEGGEAVIANKAAWPRWRPTDSMIERSPKHYGKFKDGVAGGPSNPMGARALYMHKDGRDTYYRVHGTNDPTSIGKAVSAGCIRLLNQDIIDLYDRVQPGARIVVH